MKQKYEGYKVGSEVWAISKSLKETDSCSIYPAKVKGFVVEYEAKNNKIQTQYLLETPSGQEWGNYVDAEDVSDSFDELVNKMKEIWTKNANTF